MFIHSEVEETGTASKHQVHNMKFRDVSVKNTVEEKHLNYMYS